jgi:hypothetical protein
VFDGTRKGQVRAAWVNAQRAELTVQALIALIRNRVTQLGYEALRYFCTEGATPRYGRHPITVRSLKVLGMQVNDAMLLGPATSTDQDVIAYLPFDDDCPLQEFTSLEKLTNHLIDRLRNNDYRQRFLEHIGQGDRPKMGVELDKALLKTAVVVSPPPGRLPTGIRPVNPPDLVFASGKSPPRTGTICTTPMFSLSRTMPGQSRYPPPMPTPRPARRSWIRGKNLA